MTGVQTCALPIFLGPRHPGLRVALGLMRADPADDDPDEDAGGEGAGQPHEVHLAGVDAGGEVHHLEDLADVDAQETGEQPGRPPSRQERGRARGFGARDGEAVGPEFLSSSRRGYDGFSGG